MKLIILLLFLISVSGYHYLISISNSNDNSYINDSILFYSTNHQKFKWSCLKTSSSSLSSTESSTLSSLIVPLSSSTSSNDFFSPCKYDSNHYIYQKQQYQKTVRKV